MPYPASHESRNLGKLPLSCWLMKTESVAWLFARACAIAWLRRVMASSQLIGVQWPFALTIGPRKRSGLYRPWSADCPRAQSAPRFSG